MREIYLLTDYKGYFGSKYNSVPYRSGMNKELLKKYLNEYRYKCVFINLFEVDFRIDWNNRLVLYTSQEDLNCHYKSYVEDVIFGLELEGANVIPAFKYLRAHNNKVFMEILRKNLGLDLRNELNTYHFGAIDELKKFEQKISYPVVLKGATGSMSKNVFIARDRKELFKNSKKLSKSCYFFYDIKDILRKFRHKGYKRESKYRQKFIVQEFIPNLKNDWKVVVFGSRFYVLYREVRKNDFRASGSKKFRFNEDNLIPEGLLDFAQQFYFKLKVPWVSLDIIKKNKFFYVVEFQTIYFGTSTHLKSNGYFFKNGNKWEKKHEILDLEKVYVDSLIENIKTYNL